MQETLFYTPADSAALGYAATILQQQGCRFVSQPEENVTHLLLGVPVKEVPETVLEALPPHITVVGGRLDIPRLSGYRKLDLLQDPFYTAENADITARGALQLAAGKLPVTLKDCPVLVVGWGRIGKCLARLLKAQDARVWVAARRPEQQAMLRALSYEVASLNDLTGYRVIFNTADGCGMQNIPKECLKLDLASVQGILDRDTLWARGLPGTLTPESSGRLIAQTVLRLLRS